MGRWKAAAVLTTTAAIWALERYGRRSGSTREEARAALPGDDVVARPLWASTRAVTIDAPPEQVWPWIVQMGFPPHRAGWYTPHWLDVALWGDRPRSADRIVAELQDLKVGDTVPDSADYSIYYEVEAVVPPARAQEPDSAPAHLLLHSVRHVFGPIKESDFTWAFVLRRLGAARTRLLVRARVAYRPLWALPLIEVLLNVGDVVNVSFMLRNIKRLAEHSA
jgi:hypothetical protein